MNELVGEQKIERAVNCRRAELAAFLLELCEQRIGSRRLVGSEDQLENPPADRRHSGAPQCADPLRPCKRGFDLVRRHAGWPPHS